MGLFFLAHLFVQAQVYESDDYNPHETKKIRNKAEYFYVRRCLSTLRKTFRDTFRLADGGVLRCFAGNVGNIFPRFGIIFSNLF